MEMNERLAHAIARAEHNGASAADAVGVDVVDGHVRVRMGEVDQLQRARQRALGLRVFFGKRQAITCTSDLRTETLDRVVDETCTIARLTAEDEMSGLPDPAAYGAYHAERPDLYDAAAEDFELDEGARWARSAEAAAMAVDPRIENSGGAEFGFRSVLRSFRASGGVEGSYRSTGFSAHVVPIARGKDGMERDYWFSQRRHLADLETPEVIGRIAAERTLRRLGARQEKTCEVPVIFDELMASRLLGYLCGALSGYSVYRGTSFLAGRLGETIASELVSIVDDPTLEGGMGSKPYDGEGVGTQRKEVVEKGRLNTYLLDCYSGRKLDLATTGNAARSVGDAPTVGATNFHMTPGDRSPEDLLAGVEKGFYVTELIGFGVNGTTGDYSQGAAGIWVENGALSHAVSEVTIAGNLLGMFKDIDAIGNRVDPNRGVSAPAFRIKKMMVAGA